jgi:microcin C transport system permease protein
MIEGFLIKNELTLKRYRRFKARKLAVISVLILLLSCLLTLMAPIIANSRPIFMSYNDQWYFPVLKNYHPKEFGITDSMSMNYREFIDQNKLQAIWPVLNWDPFESNSAVENYPAPPSKVNLFGTDDRGRDVLVRLLYGFKYSIAYAMLVWFITYMMGTILGAVMGFLGGKIDFLGQRIVEVLSTVPQFFLLIILISMVTPNLFWLVIISSLFSWIPISYYVRGEFLKNRKREFVEAARALGASRRSIIFKHILPNSLTPIITFTPFAIAANISGLASLDYLGFGLEVPTPSWGELLAQAQKYYTVAPWLAFYPSLCLFSTLLLFNLIGEGVRDAMDPNIH